MDIDVTDQLTRIERVTFRGTDCEELAARYVAYRRNMGLDVVAQDPDVIRPALPLRSEDA